MDTRVIWKAFFLFLLLFSSGCSLPGQPGKSALSSGLIITPSSYYSTLKARRLGEKYQRHLEGLVQELVRNPVTERLQFANNIASVGGIGFFTHSATASPDERYLEVVLGAPEVFNDQVDVNYKVDHLFSLYGFELLSVLTSDADIYNDKDVAGYGLNFSWRTTTDLSGKPRIGLERAVIYISKEETRRFLDQKASQSLLKAAIIYAIGTDGSPNQIAYIPPEDRSGQSAVALNETVRERRAVISLEEIEPVIQEQELSPVKQPEQSVEQSIPERTVLAKTPKKQDRSEQDMQETKDRRRTNKESLEKESSRSGGKEIPQKRPTTSEQAKIPSPVEAAKRSESPEKKVQATPEPELKEKPPVTQEVSEAHPMVARKEEVKVPPQAEVPKPREALEKTPETKPEKAPSPKETAEKSPVAAKKDEVKVPPPVEVRRETPEKKAEAKPLLTEKAPGAKEIIQKGLPEPKEEETKVPSASIEIAKRRMPPEERETPRLLPKEKAPVEEERPAGELLKSPAMHGYLVQLLFSDASEAQSWSQQLAREGYAISSSMVKGEEVVRLRVGAFPSSLEAGLFLERLRKQGLTGIVLFQAPKVEPAVAKKDAGEKVASVSLRGEIVGRGSPVEEKIAEQTERSKKYAEPTVSPEARKEVSDVRLATPKADVKPPESKKAPEEKAEPKLALKKKLTVIEEKRPAEELPKPSGMRGYLVQLSFLERAEAERWSELLKHQGYSTSMSMVRGDESIRLRVGAFASPVEANRLIQKLQKEGLAGFVIQAPK